jgi:peptide/nickel transport system permease protein
MVNYIIRRLLLLIPTVLAMSILIFVVVRAMPGDIVDAMMGVDATVTPEEKADLRRELGLDRPIHLQYFEWLKQILRGDLGISFRTEEPMRETLMRSLPITLELATLSILLSVIVAIPAGVISAVRPNSVWDMLSHAVGMGGLSFPGFWLGTMFLLVTSLWLHWVPPMTWIPPTENLWGNLKQMFLPALSLAIRLMAVEMRMVRSSMLEVLNQDYIKTARAKGLGERVVIFRHALKNAFIPVVTVIGLQMGSLLGGSVVTEQLFGLTGIGWTLVQGVFNRDYPVMQVTALMLAVIFVLMNLVVDIAYAFLDPRIRYE